MTSMGEAWNQASGITGIDTINTDVGFALGASLALLEVLWWAAVAYIAARRISTRQAQHPDSATDTRSPQSAMAATPRKGPAVPLS